MQGVLQPVSQLAQSLARARTADGAAAEVVQWLRAVAEVAPSIPKPDRRSPNRSYSRTLLHRCPQFEILVLHWDAGCASAIHDHGGAYCWLAVASGNMGVENFLRCDSGATPDFAQIRFDGRELLAPGAIDHRQDDVHLHRCIAADGPAVTLHVYAHPIDRFHTFDERTERCFEVTSTYDAILNA
jgi:cysteine dioxygenase